MNRIERWATFSLSLAAGLACVMAACFVLAGSLPAWAQSYMGAFGVPFNNPVSATLSTSAWNNWTIYQLQQRKAGASGSSTTDRSSTSSSASSGNPSSTRPTTQAVEASLRFHPTGTRLLAPKLVDELGKTPAQKEQVSAILNLLFQEFDKQAMKLGKPNDLAFALSYFLAQNATVFRGKPDPKDEQFVELRETVVALMGQNGGFAKMTDRQKQELHEMLVSYTGLVYLTYQDAKRRGDVENVKAMRELAGLNLKAITHLDPERINFTEQGLIITPVNQR